MRSFMREHTLVINVTEVTGKFHVTEARQFMFTRVSLYVTQESRESHSLLSCMTFALCT